MSDCSHLPASKAGGGENKELKRYVGIDVGKQKCAVAIMDQEGFVIDEFAFENSYEGIEQVAHKLSMDDKVVMESTANYWLNLYNILDRKHIEVVLANPLKTKAIAWAKIKSDEIDDVPRNLYD